LEGGREYPKASLDLSFCLLSIPQEYELRKHARNEGRRYCDPIVLTYQAERMPEQIRLKVGFVCVCVCVY